MRYAKTVNLTYGEKKALERKYGKIMNKIARAKKVTRKICEANYSMEEIHFADFSAGSRAPTDKNRKDSFSAEGEDGLFFKYAYRYYFLLDLPAREAFAKFCECMRTADKAKAAAYLLLRGEADRDGLDAAADGSMFGYKFGMADKFEFLRKICFDAKEVAV